MIRAALLLTLVASQAQALSCVRPDAAVTFNRVADAAETYHVLHGRFSFDASAMPGMNGKPAAIPARFEGLGLAGDGFTVPLETAVTLDVGCVGPWCGGIAPDREMLVFVEKRADGLHLDLSACTDTVFDAPDPALLQQIAQCYRDGRCDTP